MARILSSMDLSDLLEPERIRCHCSVQSKKRTLQTLAELLGESLRARARETADSGSDEHKDNDGETRSRKIRGLRKNTEKNADKADSADETLSDMQILDALIGRERLGSTGLGHGVGLPHSRLGNIDEPIAAFVTLDEGVDYESADGQKVDIVMGLLVPQECNDEHLKILAQLAKRFSDATLRENLRSFTDAEHLYAHISALEPAAPG